MNSKYENETLRWFWNIITLFNPTIFFLTNIVLHIKIVKSFFNGFPLVQINLVNKELGFKFSVHLRFAYFVEIENFLLKVL